jgi:hypothetical protein
MHMFQNKDWKFMENKLSPLNLFPALGKLRLGLRPKDVGTFMSEPLRHSCILSLGQLMPTLCAVMDPTIEVFDGMSFYTFLYSCQQFFFIGHFQIGLNNSQRDLPPSYLFDLIIISILECGS